MLDRLCWLSLDVLPFDPCLVFACDCGNRLWGRKRLSLRLWQLAIRGVVAVAFVLLQDPIELTTLVLLIGYVLEVLLIWRVLLLGRRVEGGRVVRIWDLLSVKLFLRHKRISSCWLDRIVDDTKWFLPVSLNGPLFAIHVVLPLLLCFRRPVLRLLDVLRRSALVLLQLIEFLLKVLLIHLLKLIVVRASAIVMRLISLGLPLLVLLLLLGGALARCSVPNFLLIVGKGIELVLGHILDEKPDLLLARVDELMEALGAEGAVLLMLFDYGPFLLLVEGHLAFLRLWLGFEGLFDLLFESTFVVGVVWLRRLSFLFLVACIVFRGMDFNFSPLLSAEQDEFRDLRVDQEAHLVGLDLLHDLPGNDGAGVRL